jgi:hypothetical protein
VVRKPHAGLKGGPVTPRARRRDRQRDAILRAGAAEERGFAAPYAISPGPPRPRPTCTLLRRQERLCSIARTGRSIAFDAVAAARRASPSAAERLRLVLTAHVRTLLDDIEGATAHLQIESLPPALRAAIVKKRDRYEHAVRRLIAAGIRSGELVDLNPALVTRAMLGAMNWTVTWFGRTEPRRGSAK